MIHMTLKKKSLVRRLRAQATKSAAASDSIVKRLDVIKDIGTGRNAAFAEKSLVRKIDDTRKFLMDSVRMLLL